MHSDSKLTGEMMKESFSSRDEFKRKPIAERIIKLLSSKGEISTVVLDAPWGSGKTDFCKKFCQLSAESNADLTCVYLDAFKYDHTDDPLLMLTTQISSLMKDDSKKKEYLKKAIPVLKVLGKTTGRAVLSWGLRTNADELGADLSKALSYGGEQTIDNSLKRFLEPFENSF